METVHTFLTTLSDLVWGPFMLMLLVGTGCILSIMLRFINVRKLMTALKLAFTPGSKTSGEGDISPFQALTTALSATVGTGNIAGVATAITLGGPGAIFWMWVCAFFGMATKYSEAVLAVKYRRHLSDGTMCGGPMHYLTQGLGLKWLGCVFAFFGVLASFGIGNMVQANSVALALQDAFSIPPGLTGLVLAALTALVIIGGIKRIGRVTSKVIPFMAVFYIGFALVIIIGNISGIPAVVKLIFTHAFTPCAAGGGFLGATVAQAIRFGFARGVFSNEAGLGSSPIAHAAARTDSPVRQGLIAMTEVFIDTILICSITAFVILLSPDVWQSGLQSSSITSSAFENFLPGIGKYVVAIGLCFFAYSTLIGWSYYGEECIEFLLGLKARIPYRVVFCALVVIGALQEVKIVWTFSDVTNGAMAIPNLVGLLGLSYVVYQETVKYFSGGEEQEGGCALHITSGL
jgi:alanine or glycine:cation symporter, AGCS family